MTTAETEQEPSPLRVWSRSQARRVPGLHGLLRLMLETFRICMRYRVTGLASEAGFFALLSLPPLVYGLLGVAGYVGPALGGHTVNEIVASIERSLTQVLSSEALQNVLMPTLRDALNGGRPDVISVGFLLSLWSGSRMLNVLIDTISIMYGQGGVRGIVRARSLSVFLYFAALLFSGLVLPLIVLGPDLLGKMLPPGFLFLLQLYWPVVGGLTIVGFTTLFYLATPQRTPWIRDVPGAVFTLLAWVVVSVFLRSWLTYSVGGISIYGPLAAAIIVLIWMYFLSITVLIGAAVNAAVARLWPVETVVGVRARTMGIIGEGVARVRSRSAADPYDQEDQELSGSRHARPMAERVQRKPAPESDEAASTSVPGAARDDQSHEDAARRSA